MAASVVLSTLLLWAEDSPRVFVTDSQSWEISGGGGGSAAGIGGSVKGGARPQTAEIIKTFGEKCPGVTINNQREKADYVVLLDHEGGKGVLRKDNKVAVFNQDGDSIVSRSTRTLGSSVNVACQAIIKDWTSGGSARAASTGQRGAAPAAPKSTAKVEIASQPSGAEIEVDDSFKGNTPSALELPAGKHTIKVTLSGHKQWKREIDVTAGSEVKLNADLEK